MRSKPTEQYTPAHILSRSLGLSSLALARITSSLLVEGKDGSKTNIGLSLKFESKGMKVLGYTRKADRGWEYSRKAYELVREYMVSRTGFAEIITPDTSGDPTDQVPSSIPRPEQQRPWHCPGQELLPERGESRRKGQGDPGVAEGGRRSCTRAGQLVCRAAGAGEADHSE